MMQFFLLGMIFLATVPGTAFAEGRLVIAGGAVREDNHAVWQAFADGVKPEGTVFIIAGASSAPQASAASARRALAAVGVPPERVEIAPLALRDDPSTEADEALWADHGSDAELAAAMQSAAGIWFTGGDQSRLTILLREADDAPTPVLLAMHEANADGAAIGGTSAGAAMMSRVMITGGSSVDALLTGPRINREDGFTLAPGLGFLPAGVVDQHFGERARLGRLIRAVSVETEPARRIGFGVDEGTALIVDADRYSVVGEGYVTVVDAAGATFGTTRGRFWAKGLVLHLLSTGDEIEEDGTITAASYKEATLGNEYNDRAPNEGGGMAIAGTSLADVLGEDLLDNKGARKVEKLSVTGDGRGFQYRFRQDGGSQGFWGRAPDGEGRYTITGVSMEIAPVTVDVKELPQR